MQGMTGADGSAADGALPQQPFCASQTNPIFCADFDKPDALTPFKTKLGGNGKISLGKTFPGGSAPSAVNASVGSNEEASIATPTLSAVANGGTQVEISLLANVTLPGNGTVKFITLQFTNGDKVELTLDKNGNIIATATVSPIPPQATMLTGIAAGEHPLRASMSIGSSSTTIVFYVDNKPYTPPTLPIKEPNSFTLTLGASNTSTSYTIDYDNVLVE
jgi:hypothetical protein